MINNGSVQGPKEIPLAICYCAEHDQEFEVSPPLLDLAHANVAHFQVRSDHRHSLHIASIPLLVFKGRPQVKDGQQARSVRISAYDVPKDGDVKYVEHSGTALEATRNELKDLEGPDGGTRPLHAPERDPGS
jgi:hypothetical protein